MIERLLNEFIEEVNVIGNEEIVFKTKSNKTFKMCHYQDCCEEVFIEDICGDLQSMVGNRVLMAEMVKSTEPTGDEPYHDESFTWTFYKLATMGGYVTIRWFGTSNGYYSEEVDFVEVTE